MDPGSREPQVCQVKKVAKASQVAQEEEVSGMVDGSRGKYYFSRSTMVNTSLPL